PPSLTPAPPRADRPDTPLPAGPPRSRAASRRATDGSAYTPPSSTRRTPSETIAGEADLSRYPWAPATNAARTEYGSSAADSTTSRGQPAARSSASRSSPLPSGRLRSRMHRSRGPLTLARARASARLAASSTSVAPIALRRATMDSRSSGWSSTTMAVNASVRSTATPFAALSVMVTSGPCPLTSSPTTGGLQHSLPGAPRIIRPPVPRAVPLVDRALGLGWDRQVGAVLTRTPFGVFYGDAPAPCLAFRKTRTRAPGLHDSAPDKLRSQGESSMRRRVKMLLAALLLVIGGVAVTAAVAAA